MDLPEPLNVLCSSDANNDVTFQRGSSSETLHSPSRILKPMLAQSINSISIKFGNGQSDAQCTSMTDVPIVLTGGGGKSAIVAL
jgi:hypothetical protein